MVRANPKALPGGRSRSTPVAPRRAAARLALGIGAATLLSLESGCVGTRGFAHECSRPEALRQGGDVESYGFDGELDHYLRDHPAWRSEEATFTQRDGVARLSASGVGISEAWKVWHEPLPTDRSWSIAVIATVPSAWGSTRTATDAPDDPQVGAGPWLGMLDPEGKGRRVYEVNLAAISGRVRFVQGQLIQNRLGEDPIHVGHIVDVPESVRLEVVFCAVDDTISLYCDGALVDSQPIDERGLDDWNLTDDDVLYAGVMGFAEWTDLEQDAVVLDDFEVVLGPPDTPTG